MRVLCGFYDKCRTLKKINYLNQPLLPDQFNGSYKTTLKLNIEIVLLLATFYKIQD